LTNKRSSTFRGAGQYTHSLDSSIAPKNRKAKPLPPGRTNYYRSDRQQGDVYEKLDPGSPHRLFLIVHRGPHRFFCFGDLDNSYCGPGIIFGQEKNLNKLLGSPPLTRGFREGGVSMPTPFLFCIFYYLLISVLVGRCAGSFSGPGGRTRLRSCLVPRGLADLAARGLYLERPERGCHEFEVKNLTQDV
jgi:hypothetical protein